MMSERPAGTPRPHDLHHDQHQHGAPGAVATMFPPAGHDHHACAADTLARAEAICRAEGLTLSPGRRRVLVALARSHAPMGAYDLIEQLAAEGPRPAPITVYRALSFLTENGLAHRIERLNAFVACAGNHDAARPLVFLICDRCGQVGEVAADAVGIDLERACAPVGFRPRSAALEILGVCRHCAELPDANPPG
jgi:Fur family zinc uptake transcriptional regulator